MAVEKQRLTILIVARNAAATIERAVASCLAETGCPIILADDHSTDNTVALALSTARSRLRLVAVPDPGGVALARQAALDAVETPIAAWLDADDEWIAGRADRLCALLRDADIAVESIDLHDGPSGTWLRRLDTPQYLKVPGGAVRLFERNNLPGDSQVAFKTDVYRNAGGFDPAIHGPESFDVMLRAVAHGARLAAGDAVGYRMYAYPGSVSRGLARQRAALARALGKHSYDGIQRLYTAAGYSDRIAAWAVVIVAQFRDDALTALRFLDQACPADADPSDVLEPEGPWPLVEGWRRAFHLGTALLAVGGRDEEAASALSHAEAIDATAEGANNLGVALARIGRQERAAQSFAAAARRFSGYQDAMVNAASASPDRITTHPLRRQPSRHEYSLVIRDS
jgi:glycosyltransferase involved in cell wall biosynthesis